MKKQHILFSSAFAICFIFCSCNNNHDNKEAQGNDTTAAAVDVKDTAPSEMAKYNFSYTIANLPSPMQVFDEFAKSNLPVEITLLNPTENANNYHTSFKQAFNYGIYGVDMGYLVVNNRTLESIKYYTTAKNLAEQLNMGETFNRFVTRFQNNQNKDSLAHVLDEAYAATDSYLHSSERLETASEILAGSWIECQHLTVELLKNTEHNANNDKLFDRVWEQRLHLENITKILEEFKSDAELLKIKKEFEDLLLIYKEPRDPKDINKDFLVKLSKNLDELRNKIIN